MDLVTFFFLATIILLGSSKHNQVFYLSMNRFIAAAINTHTEKEDNGKLLYVDQVLQPQLWGLWRKYYYCLYGRSFVEEYLSFDTHDTQQSISQHTSFHPSIYAQNNRKSEYTFNKIPNQETVSGALMVKRCQYTSGYSVIIHPLCMIIQCAQWEERNSRRVREETWGCHVQVHAICTPT